MIELPTWAGRSSFKYEGSVEKGTKIFFGSEYSQTVFISGQDYQSMLSSFNGKTVNIGTSRTDLPDGSLGAWLQSNVTKEAIASYIGPILIEEGYAEKDEGAYIRFFRS